MDVDVRVGVRVGVRVRVGVGYMNIYIFPQCPYTYTQTHACV